MVSVTGYSSTGSEHRRFSEGIRRATVTFMACAVHLPQGALSALASLHG